MRFVIVTGMSGAGKRTAMKMLEDMGFFCVDNLPLPLMGKFAELCTMPGSELSKVAIGLDIRTGMSLEGATESLDELDNKGIKADVLFMEASEHVILKRYKESRRVHPAAVPGERIELAIARERERLEPIKKRAGYVIDTSMLLTRVLREELEKIFLGGEEYNSLMINIVSFGFKYGIPQDADLVFDVRFLPNPFYIEELKSLTGNDAPVSDYVMSFAESGIFLDKLTDMMKFLIPNYVSEGKNQLVIAIGCTGGRHRSVTLANRLFYNLKGQGNYGISLDHRDAGV